MDALPIRYAAEGVAVEFDARCAARERVLTSSRFLEALDDFWDVAYPPYGVDTERQ